MYRVFVCCVLMLEIVSSLCRRLRRDESGAVLPMFTIAVITLLLITAVSVDYGSALVTKQKLTNAADAAALAVGGDPTLSQEQANAKAEAYIKAHYPDADFGDLVDFQVVPTASQVDVTVTARIPTTFLKVARIDTIDVTVHSQVLRQQRDLEVVLVLDNTGSMDYGTRTNGTSCRKSTERRPENCISKMDSLKVAANKLVSILFGDDATSEHVKIGLVPFSAAVNVGTDKLGTGWIDEAGSSFLQTEDIDLPSGMTLLGLFDQLRNTSWAGCVRARLRSDGTDLELTDDAPTGPDTRWVPYFAPDEPEHGGYYNNYIDDGLRCGSWGQPACRTSELIAAQRNASHYNNATPRNSDPNFNCVPQSIEALTNVKSTITTAIDGMQPEGSTVIPVGLAWGWRVVSPTAPYTEGAPYSEQRVAKAIILLTDGRNQVEASNGHNHSFYNAYGYSAEGHLGADTPDGSNTRPALDQKTRTLCTNVKANKDDIADDQDIYIYTITFQVDDDSARTLMSSCATPPADCPGEKCYYDSPTGADLEDAFESIALGLNKLRVAK